MSNDKRTDAELLALLESVPPAGSRWRHYKTMNVYEVLGAAILEASQEPLVIYRHSAITFARPASEWEEMVAGADGGELVPRFRRVEVNP